MSLAISPTLLANGMIKANPFRSLRARLQQAVDHSLDAASASRESPPRRDGVEGRTPGTGHPPGHGSRRTDLGPLDYLFRALVLAGGLEIVGLIFNLMARPEAPGVVGQALLIRIWAGLVVGPVLLAVAGLLLWRAPGNVWPRFLIIVDLGAIGMQFNTDLGAPIPSAWVTEILIVYVLGLVGPSLGFIMFTFPTGRVFPPAWARAIIGASVVKFAGVILEILATPGRIKIFTLSFNPLFVPALAPYRTLIAQTIGLTSPLLPLFLLAGAVSLVLRYRASPPLEKQQIKWVIWGFGILVPTGLSAIGAVFTFGAASWQFQLAIAAAGVGQVAVLTSIANAVLRYHLFDIDRLINRTLVYGSLTLIVVSAYVITVGAISELFHASGSFVLSLLATGLVAVFFQPLRERLQRAVNRLLYGERDEPYAVLSRLGQRLEATPAPEAVLPALVETIAQALKLPYVAVALQAAGQAESQTAAAYGLASTTPTRLPLTYQSERIGELLIAARGPDESFSPAEQRLLQDIAHQAGIAAHAVQLTADLQRSRERLVTAREEERRRLRRDLHDGLGPALAIHSLKVGMARSLLARHLPGPDNAVPGRTDVASADAVLAELERDIAATLTDIRRLVYDLRPPTLDELGLVAAIRESAARYAPNSPQNTEALRITLDAPEHVPPLAAAVEVAAFRITQEALTNVVRHARARTCRIGLKLDDGLWLEITDDGLGLPDSRAEGHTGVGLASMRERAAELGGSCVIESPAAGGTRVLAHLPLGHGRLR